MEMDDVVYTLRGLKELRKKWRRRGDPVLSQQINQVIKERQAKHFAQANSKATTKMIKHLQKVMP